MDILRKAQIIKLKALFVLTTIISNTDTNN
jgi:hypothetical protein